MQSSRRTAGETKTCSIAKTAVQPSLEEARQYWIDDTVINIMLRGECRRPHVQKLVMLPRKNSCSRDLASHDTTMAAASRLSALRHRTVPMLSVSTSACVHRDAHL